MRPSLGKISSGFWKPRNFTLSPRPRRHQLVALAGVVLVLVFGAHDPALDLGHARRTTERMARTKPRTSLMGTTRPMQADDRGGDPVAAC